MSKSARQLALGLEGDKPQQRTRGEWLQSFYAKAYAAGKEAGWREAEERYRLELELLATKPAG